MFSLSFLANPYRNIALFSFLNTTIVLYPELLPCLSRFTLTLKRFLPRSATDRPFFRSTRDSRIAELVYPAFLSLDKPFNNEPIHAPSISHCVIVYKGISLGYFVFYLQNISLLCSVQRNPHQTFDRELVCAPICLLVQKCRLAPSPCSRLSCTLQGCRATGLRFHP